MIDRYTLPRMGAIWSKENKFKTWLEVEIAVCEAWAKIGVIPDWVPEAIRQKAQIEVDRIEEIERTETRHDLIAFCKAVSEHLGEEARYLHFGITSYDIEDPALSLLLKQSADILLEDCAELIEAIREQARRHKYTLMIGRTHGIHAEPITFGFKLAGWLEEMQNNVHRLQQAKEAISYGKVSGAVGTYANVDPRVEEYVCQKLGLKPAPVATQILSRDRHAQFITTLAILSSSLEKFATEIRNLQRTEIREVEEPFYEGQRGSSAMPHKRNPATCEQISGLARVLRGYVLPALENIVTWHERDLANSSVERIILPDACIVVDYQLQTFTRVVRDLQVYPEQMEKNLHLLGGLVASQQILLALVNKGMLREEAYKIVQELAMEGWQRGNFRDLLLTDPRITAWLSPKEIEKALDPSLHLKNLDLIFERLGI